MRQYYIISLKHTQKENKWITLWRPDNRGYCYSQEDAGVYEEIKEGYHNMEGDSLPIDCSRLYDYFIPCKMDGGIKKAVPNIKQVHDMLGLKMTKSGLIINKK